MDKALFDAIKAALNYCDERQFYVVPFELRDAALAALGTLEIRTAGEAE